METAKTTPKTAQGLVEPHQGVPSVGFYDIRAKVRVHIPLSQCRKVIYGTETSPRYAIRGQVKSENGDKWLTRFINAAIYQALEIPVEEKEVG